MLYLCAVLLKNIMAAISVLIPVYNADTFIKETIDSVLFQSFRDFELLIMDDGSTDHSAKIICSYSDPRIRYELCPHNFTATLNKGIEMTQGKYIALIDHDDMMMPERLQTQFDYMEANPDIAACGAYMQTFGSSSFKMTVPTEHDDIFRSMLLNNPIFNPTGFIRKNVLIEHNIRYQDGYSFTCDYKFWTDIVKVGKLANLPKILTKYRTHGKQTNIIYGNQMAAAACVIQYEMLQYFMTAFAPSEEMGTIAAEKVLPGIEILNERGFFPRELYFKFMNIPGGFHIGMSVRCYADRYYHSVINYDGKIYKCTAHTAHEDGILHDNGIIEWNHKTLVQLYSNATFENKRCIKCKHLPLCLGPCSQNAKDKSNMPCFLNISEITINQFIIETYNKKINNLLNK
jgi:radical SAM protein with 4Fe4S-binding SPASM domain